MWWIAIIVALLLVGCIVGLIRYNKIQESKGESVSRNIVEDRPIMKPNIDLSLPEEPVQKELKEDNQIPYELPEVKEQNKYIKEIKNMSPEMKAIVFADIFDRKHF